MGKATIVSHQGDALYRVTINYDRTAADALIAQLTAERAAVQATLPGLQAAITAAEAVWNTANAGLTTAIATGVQDLIRAAQVTLLEAQIGVGTAQSRYNQADLHQIALLRQITTLQAQLPTDHEVDAWCADYQEGLSGEVGTIEVARREEKAPNYIIEPGGLDGSASAFSDARDGQLVPTMSQLPAQAMHAYMFLPGAAKWRPRYRTGVVTGYGAAAGTLNVDLDATLSTHQGLNVNQAASLVDVPVSYMDAGVEIFGIGDEVVVRFGSDPTDWADPTVIGFVHDPVPVDDPFLYHGQTLNWPGTPPHTFEYNGVPIDDIDWGGVPYPQRVLSLTPDPTTNRTIVSWPMWDEPIPAVGWDAVIYDRAAVTLTATDSLGQSTPRSVWAPQFDLSEISRDYFVPGNLSLTQLFPGYLIETVYTFVEPWENREQGFLWTGSGATQPYGFAIKYSYGSAQLGWQTDWVLDACLFYR